MLAHRLRRAGATDAVDISRVYTTSDTAVNSNSKTWTGASIGDAASTRFLILAISFWDNDTNDASVTVGVTVDGAAPTLIGGNPGNDPVPWTGGCYLYSIAKPTGTTADVAVTLTGFAGTMDAYQLSIYRVVGKLSITPLDTISFVIATGTNLGTLDTAAGGFAIVAGARFSLTPSITPNDQSFSGASPSYVHILDSGQSAGTQAYTASQVLVGYGASWNADP